MPEKLSTQGLHKNKEKHFSNEGGCDEQRETKKEGMKKEISQQKKQIYYVCWIYPKVPASTTGIKQMLDPVHFWESSTLQDWSLWL